jgi:hypothetical protein
MSMISIAGLFNEMLGNVDVNDPRTKSMFPFDLRVGCVKMAAPRHERFDMIREMGAETIDRIFKGEPIMQSELTFVFPERHMGVHEQQCFMIALLNNPNIDKIISVDLISSSPLIMSSFNRECMRILTWPDDDKHNGQTA